MITWNRPKPEDPKAPGHGRILAERAVQCSDLECGTVYDSVVYAGACPSCTSRLYVPITVALQDRGDRVQRKGAYTVTTKSGRVVELRRMP